MCVRPDFSRRSGLTTWFKLDFRVDGDVFMAAVNTFIQQGAAVSWSGLIRSFISPNLADQNTYGPKCVKDHQRKQTLNKQFRA